MAVWRGGRQRCGPGSLRGRVAAVGVGSETLERLSPARCRLGSYEASRNFFILLAGLSHTVKASLTDFTLRSGGAIVSRRAVLNDLASRPHLFYILESRISNIKRSEPIR